MPTSAGTAHRQQPRWESGNARLARRGALIALEGARRRDANLALAGLELLLPPQTLLIVTNAACLAAAFTFGGRGLRRSATATTAGQVVYVLGGLRAAGAPPVVYRALAATPRLVGRKLAIFARIAGGHGTEEWLRTDREAPVRVAAEV